MLQDYIPFPHLMNGGRKLVLQLFCSGIAFDIDSASVDVVVVLQIFSAPLPHHRRRPSTSRLRSR